MSEFITTVTIRRESFSAEQARESVDRLIRQAEGGGYLREGTTTVASVEPYVAPRTYSQDEFDAAVLAAAVNARENALAGINE